MTQDPRTETIQALDAFIEAQQRLLARQESDIERLQELRGDLRERPSGVLSNLSNELDHGTFRLSAQTDLRLVLPQGFDWNAFDKADTNPLGKLLFGLRQKRAVVPRTQQSPLSELQVLVKTAKKERFDPLLESIAKGTLALQLDSEDEEDIDPLERIRFEERTKILELKKRKVRGGGSGLSLPMTRNVVFVRDDLEDETGEVDIDSWSGEKKRNRDKANIASKRLVEGPAETPPKSCLKANGRSRSKTSETTCPVADEERPRKKVKLLLSATSGPHPSAESPTPLDDDDQTIMDRHEDAPVSDDDVRTKRKSETHKQAWSVDEQNLLEQLLEAIPAGEQYRWLKISRAMGGRRTPRQVASRMQKYFEKLKKFGVSVD